MGKLLFLFLRFSLLRTASDLLDEDDFGLQYPLQVLLVSLHHTEEASPFFAIVRTIKQ